MDRSTTDILLIIAAIFTGIGSLAAGLYGYLNSRKIEKVDKQTDGHLTTLTTEITFLREMVIGLTDKTPEGSYKKVKTEVEADTAIKEEIKKEINKTEFEVNKENGH